MGGKVIDTDNDNDTDVVALKSGKISVTPIHFDLTNYAIMDMLKSWDISE
jgi:5'-nucleotidase